MTQLTQDRKQAKSIDNHFDWSDARIWQRGKTNYEQTYRNNHFAPQVLFSNKRISAMPGNWGIVIAQSADAAWTFGFALEETGSLPDEIGKLFCVSVKDAQFMKEADIDALATSGIKLVYDESDSIEWPGGTLVASDMLAITNDRKYGWGKHVIWNGEVPQAYIDEAEAEARYKAYERAENELRYHFSKTGAGWYGDISRQEVISELSFGFLSLDDFPEPPDYAHITNFNCVYRYETSDYDVYYAEQFSKAHAVIGVWEHALASSGIQLRRDASSHGMSADEARKQLDAVIATGRALGYDSFMSVHIAEGIPLSDLFA